MRVATYLAEIRNQLSEQTGTAFSRLQYENTRTCLPSSVVKGIQTNGRWYIVGIQNCEAGVETHPISQLRKRKIRITVALRDYRGENYSIRCSIVGITYQTARISINSKSDLAGNQTYWR